MSLTRLSAQGRSIRKMIREFPLFSPLLRFVQRRQAESLGKYGLCIDDVAIEYPEVKACIDHMSPAEKLARQQRIYRAFDLSAKRKVLHNIEDPFANRYLEDSIDVAREEQDERATINHY